MVLFTSSNMFTYYYLYLSGLSCGLQRWPTVEAGDSGAASSAQTPSQGWLSSAGQGQGRPRAARHPALLLVRAWGLFPPGGREEACSLCTMKDTAF